MNSAIWGALLLGVSSVGLASCGGEAQSPVEANPDAPAGLTAADGRMNLPAVAGNPAGVYFTLTNDSDKQYTIRAVSVAGAESAMLHQTTEWNLQPDMQEVFQIAVPAGETLTLTQGNMHVMAMGVAEDLAPGGESEATITFVGGDKMSIPLVVLAAGDDGGVGAGEEEGGED